MTYFPVTPRPTRKAPHPLAAFATCLVACLAMLPAALSAAADSEDEAGEALLQAENALQAGLYKEASEHYREAAELSDDPEIAKRATRVSHSYGFNEDALESAERWVKLDEASDESLLYLAQLELRTGDLKRSKRSFLRLLRRGDEPIDERLVALIPFLSEENAEDAYWLMEQLARPYKESAAAHYAAGVMALQAGESEEAGERAQKAIELDTEWGQPHLLYARSLLLKGEKDAAIEYTARLVGDSPDPDPEARLELAIMYLAADRDDDALSQVNQVLLEQPARTDALRLMAIINFRQEHLDAAWSDFQDLLATGRHTMDALYYLARIADRRQDYEQARTLYSRVISGPNAVVSQRRVGGILAEEGKFDEAMQHLDEFGDTHPNHAIDMIQARAQLLASEGRHDQALEEYDRFIAYRPDSESAVLGKAELLLRMDRLDAAIDKYREAVKRWPDSAMSLNALGYTLVDRTDRVNEAAKLIRKALDLEPTSPAIIDSWGWVLFHQGRYEEALVELERAYAGLKDPEVAAHIIETLAQLDRLEEARTVLDDAEVLFPEHPMLERVREHVFNRSREP
jgi:tetratricopeptide (TPR) repeat protein